jgi:hypothetical protein
MNNVSGQNNLDRLAGLEGGEGVPSKPPVFGQPGVNQSPAGYFPPAPQYAQPSGMYPQPKNGMGTAALVLGIIGMFPFPITGFWCSLLAIIFGSKGRKRVGQGIATNKVMATWGLWLGIVGMGIQVLLSIAIAFG